MTYAIVPGAASSPVILHVPHAARALGGARFVVGDAEIAEELDHLTDVDTDVIAHRAAAAARPRPWIFKNRLSRLVVDPERFPDDTEEMRAVGMGAVYTHGYAGRRLRDDDPVRDQALLREHFLPYAAGVTALVKERLAATGRAVIIDVHSYPAVALPYELHGAGPRPPICLGVDDFHTPPALLARAEDAFAGFEQARNTPFAGAYVPLEYYRREPAVTAVMIEIRRDQYLGDPAGLDRVVAALVTLAGSPSAPDPPAAPRR
nr:N-formylglutamate amidohydrolase [uncultured Actinoplanes sp.]